MHSSLKKINVMLNEHRHAKMVCKKGIYKGKSKTATELLAFTLNTVPFKELSVTMLLK